MAIRSAVCRLLECNSRIHSVCACVCFSGGVQEDEPDPLQCGRHSSAEETALLLPEHTDSILRYINTHRHIQPRRKHMFCTITIKRSYMSKVSVSLKLNEGWLLESLSAMISFLIT